MPSKDIIADLNLEGCPEGSVLNAWDPDQSVEEQYFQGWENPLEHPARVKIPAIQGWQVVTDDGQRVLENFEEANLCLVTGDLFWKDYTVEGTVRKMHAEGYQSKEDPSFCDGQAGFIFRYQHVRRYYYYCIEGYDRLRLYRREHDHFMPLLNVRMPFDRGRYYRLKVVLRGDRMFCYVDDKLVGDIRDGNLEAGKAGIWVNTRARFGRVTVHMAEEAQTAFVSTRSAYERKVDALREHYPQPVLHKKISFAQPGPAGVLFADLHGTGRMDMLIIQTISDGPLPVMLRAMTVEEDLLWERLVRSIGPMKIYDMNGDGKDEITCVLDGKITMLEGDTGDTVIETPVPENGPFTAPRGQPAQLHQLYIANMSGGAYPSDVIVADDYQTAWCFDGNLNQRWMRSVFHGHRASFFDVDGDGRDEMVIGYYLLDGDGNILWQVEDSEYLMLTHHVDSCAIADLDGDGQAEVAIAGSNAGFFLVEGRTGKVRRNHRVGHVQVLSVAKYCKDLPGLQVWTGNRWRNYGILTLFDGEGNELHQFEPDNLSQGMAVPANWRGDGEELLFVYTSPKSIGLYDRGGHKVVCVPPDDHPVYWKARGTAWDLVGDARDELILYNASGIWIYTQDRPHEGGALYCPHRNRGILDSMAVVSHEGWKDGT